MYRLNPPASGSNKWTYERLVSFAGGRDGSYPVSGVTRESHTGIFYGTTEYGGDTTCTFEPHHWGCGTVFELAPPTSANPKWQKVLLHRFRLEKEGRFPTKTPIIVAADTLIGTTQDGGVSNFGTAYSVQFLPSALTPARDGAFRVRPATTHWVFGDNEWLPVGSDHGQWPLDVATCGDNASPNDGDDPTGSCFCPMDGAPDNGNCANFDPCRSQGTCGDDEDCDYTECDEDDLTARRVARRYDLPGSAGAPASRDLYGATQGGGDDACAGSENQGCGVIFVLKANRRGRYVEDVLYRFAGGTDGYEPIGKLTKGPDGILYGTTLWGGTSCSLNVDRGCGTVFRLTPPKRRGDAWTETILYRFTGGSDGALPAGGVIIGADGVLYGATTYGGDCTSDTRGCGTIFKLTPPDRPLGKWREVILHAFQNQDDGANPNGALMVSEHIYGTAGNVLFEIAP